MSLLRITSPHTHGPRSTGDVMRIVMVATVPGVIALTMFFGLGSLINITLACFTAVFCEAAVMIIRRRPILVYLQDCSALLTALLLGIALPPYCPWWVVVVGTAFSIIGAKHIYGGLGFNPFNPAMAGYVVLLISFPVEMTAWAPPYSILADGDNLPRLGEALSIVLPFADPVIDGITMATPLDIFKQNNSLDASQLYSQSPVFSQGLIAGSGWEWVNIGFLLGGVFLIYKKIFTWHAPVSMLVIMTVMSLLFYSNGSLNSGGSPLFHLLSGGTMLGAFFIVTDPVTSAVSIKGRIIYGAGVGLLVFCIRYWGNYPDAIAFAVMLMNITAPFIDYYTLPRAYGHLRPRRATEKPE